MITKSKSRYLLVESSDEIDAKDKATGAGIIRAITAEIGEIEYNKANPRIAYQYNPNSFIIKMNRNYESRIVLALAFVKEVGQMPISFYTIRTSGSASKLLKICSKIYGR